MTDQNIDPRAAVIRAAGHPEAADLLDSLAAMNGKADVVVEETDTATAPTDPREVEGRALLDGLNKTSTPWHAGPSMFGRER